MNDTGYELYSRCRFSVCGSFPESVLNACAAKGIELRKAEFSGKNHISVWVYEKDREEFEKTAEECLCYIRAEERAGGRKILGCFKKNLSMVLAASFFALCLLISSLFIWDIDIVGNEKLTEGEIKRALAECGVRPGSFWPGIDSDMVRARMITKLPPLAWMSVNVSGSRAAVPVLERKSPAEVYNENGYSDLIAKNDGILERLSVRNGKALVSRGQTVEKGTVLVSGRLDSSYGETRYVRSLGDAAARTWREVTAVCPTTTLKKHSHEKKQKRYALLIGNTRINFYADSKNTVDEYDKTIHNNKLGFHGVFTFPVTVITEEFRPYTAAEEEDTAVKEMENDLLERLKKEIDGEILSTGFVSDVQNKLKRVTVRCECLENIAEEKQYERKLQNDRTDSES